MNHSLSVPSQRTIAAVSPTVCNTREGLTAARHHLWLAGVLAVIALAAGFALRLELLTPALDQFTPRSFGALLSMHGTLGFYFILMPLIPGVLGGALLPALLGRADMAFPRLARWTPALLGVGAALLLTGFVWGGTEAGWLFDAEFGGRFIQPGILPAAAGILLAAVAQVALSANVAATIASSRPVSSPFVPALLASAVNAAFASAVLLACMALVLADALWGWAAFDPAAGGDPQLFRLLIRCFTSPAHNAVALAALGTAAHVIAVRTRPSAAHAHAFARVVAGLAVVGAFAWENPVAAVATDTQITQVFAILNGGLLALGFVAIGRSLWPLRGGGFALDTAGIYALGFAVVFASCLCSGLLLALPVTRLQLGGTTFATAHLHVFAFATGGLAFLAGLHAIWPRWIGRGFSEPVGRCAALAVLLGMGCAFLPLCWLGLAGAPFRANDYAADAQVLHVLATGGATLLLGGLVVAAGNLCFGRARDAARFQ